jgi:hypothetical protein
MTHHMECVAILESAAKVAGLRVCVCFMRGVGVTGDILTLEMTLVALVLMGRRRSG